jgi:hypothetical protein
VSVGLPGGTGNRSRGRTLCSLGREGGRYGGGAVTEEQAELLGQWVEGGVAGRGWASAGEEEVEGAEEEPREELAQEAEPEAAGLLG